MRESMNVTKPNASTADTAGKTVESEICEIVRAKRPQPVDAGELCSDILRAGAASIAELDKLMGELQIARNYLRSEAERIRREATRYAQLTQTASASVKIICKSMERWRETQPPSSRADGVASRFSLAEVPPIATA